MTNTYDLSYPLISDSPGVMQHDANYGTGFLYRGNVATSASFGNTSSSAYDITGAASTSNDQSLSMTSGTATNYAAPTAITTANALTTTFTWNSFLGPHQHHRRERRYLFDAYRA